MSIIDKLWNGDVFPAEQVHPSTERYVKSISLEAELKAALSLVLTADDVEKLEALINSMYDESDEMSKEAYRMGIQFGFELSEAIKYDSKTLSMENHEADE